MRRLLVLLGLLAIACDGGSTPSPAAPDVGSPDSAPPGPECAEDEVRPCPLRDSTQRCVAGRWGPCAAVAETCDGADEDGDDAVDEGLVEPCGSAEGLCQPGLRSCVDGAWGPCIGALGPRPESCDGRDEDCDGAIDEAPILGPTRVIDSPVVGGPDALVWTGRAHAASLPGYPNWVLRFAADGTVWRADLFGRTPVAIDLAYGPDGLAVAWAERNGALMMGLAGWGQPGWGPEAVVPEGVTEVRIAGETRSTLLAWIDSDGRPWARVFDPTDGTPRFDAMPLGGPAGAEGIAVANNGDDGFAAAWRIAETGAVWFARMDNSGAAIVSFEVLDGGATSVAVLADYYVDTYAVAWSDGRGVRVARITRGAGQVERVDDIAADEPEAGALQAIRDDTVWAFFWQADGRVRGRLFDRSGQPSTDTFDGMPSGERFAMTHGAISGYAIATVREGALELRSGPIICLPAE